MATRLYPDGAQSTIPSALGSSTVTVTLTSAAPFGTISAGQQIDCVIVDSGNPGYSGAAPLATPYEYVIMTAISGNVVTLTRGQYGSSAANFFAGATISVSLVGQAIQNPTLTSLTVGTSSAEGVGGVPRKFFDNTLASNTGANGGWTIAVPSGDWGKLAIEVIGLAVGSSESSVWTRFNSDGSGDYYSSASQWTDQTQGTPNAGMGIIEMNIGNVPAATALNTGYVTLEIPVPAMVIRHPVTYTFQRLDGPSAGQLTGADGRGWWVGPSGTAAAITSVFIFCSAGFAAGGRCQAWVWA